MGFRTAWVVFGRLGKAGERPLSASSADPSADFHVPGLGQLGLAELPLNDAFEPGALEIVGLDAALGGGPVRHFLDAGTLVVDPYGAGDRGSGQLGDRLIG